MTTDKHNKRPNVPPLRFPEFSGEWERSKLGYLTTKVGSGSTPRGGNSVYIERGHCFVRSQNVGMGVLLLDDIAHIDDNTHKKQIATEIKENDVLLNITGASIGRTAVATYLIAGGNVNQHVCIIRTNDLLNHNYLCNYIQTKKIQNYIYSLQTGGSREGLNFEQVRSFPICYPSEIEQIKISHLISLLGRRIAIQSGLIEKLESLISGICKQFHDKTENWIQVSFIELGEDYSGLTNKSAGDFGKGKPYITYLNVNTNHIIDESQIQYVSVADDEKQNKVHWGDVIFTLSSETPDEVAVGSVYLGNCDELYLNSFCFGIHIVNEQYIYQPYLSYFISSPQFRKWVFPLAQGSTRFNLQKADFMKKKFLLPPIKEQKKLYDSLSTISKRVVIESSILSKLQLLKLYLLQQMFI